MPILPGKRHTRTNRRTHERIEVDSPARLTDGTVVVEGRLENLSLTGAAFIAPGADVAFQADTRITLHIAGGGDDGSDLRFPGRIVRAEAQCDATGDSISYAIAFDEPARG